MFGGNLGKSLDKEFVVKNCSKLSSYPDIVRRHQMRVPHRCPRIHVSEAFLSNGHRSVQRVQQCSVSMTEGVCSPS